MISLTEELADAVYTILVEECDAPDDQRGLDRASFVRYMSNDQGGKEWRFQGDLGFGGKCYLNGNREGIPYVSCYPEDRTTERDVIIERANARIRELIACDQCGKPYRTVPPDTCKCFSSFHHMFYAQHRIATELAKQRQERER